MRQLFDAYGIEHIDDEMSRLFSEARYLTATMTGAAVSRTDDDTWDLASSVGMTATMVAAARALATGDDRRLIDDPFAGPLVRAVGIAFFTDLLDGRIDASALGDGGPERLRAMIAGMAMRTRFFDDHFTRAGESGITQAVIPPPDWTPGPTGCPGRQRRWSTKSTGPPSSSSRRPHWPDSAPGRRRRCAPSASICAATGRPRCGTPASTRRCRPRGWPRAC